jgi:hypothetical protein
MSDAGPKRRHRGGLLLTAPNSRQSQALRGPADTLTMPRAVLANANAVVFQGLDPTLEHFLVRLIRPEAY